MLFHQQEARCKYKSYHEVEVSMWFTHRGLEVPGCVNHVGTDTEWYNRLVPWATRPWQRIYGLATIASAIKGLSTYLVTIEADTDLGFVDRSNAWHRCCQRCSGPTLATSWPFRTTTVSAVYNRQAVTSNPTRSIIVDTCSCFFERTANSAINRLAHTINAWRPAN